MADFRVFLVRTDPTVYICISFSDMGVVSGACRPGLIGVPADRHHPGYDSEQVMPYSKKTVCRPFDTLDPFFDSYVFTNLLKVREEEDK